jgi:hypothetical protein
VSETPIYDKAHGETGSGGPESTGALNEETIQRMIDQALARQAESHQREMDALRGQLANVRASMPATVIPEHAGGVGVDTIAETWSQYDQSLAQRGEHPHQHGESADWLARPEDVDETRIGNAVSRQRRTREPQPA